MNGSDVRHYENLLCQFKVNELQSLLTSFKAQKVGKKHELYQRCVDLLKNPRFQPAVFEKIREISNRASQNRPAPYPPPSMMMQPSVNHYDPRARGYASMNSMSHMMFNYPNSMHIGGAPSQASLRHVRNLTTMPLPFYDPVQTILEPVELAATPSGIKTMTKISISFGVPVEYLTRFVRDPNVFPRFEVQLRFFNITGEYMGVEQPDDFPLNATVRIDEQLVQLPNVIPTNKPNVEAKRPSRPVNITHNLNPPRDLSRPHRMSIEWSADKRSWAVGIYLVSRVNADILRNRLTQNPKHELAFDETKATIQRRLGSGDDDGIQMDSLKISLLCPLGKTRMMIAARSRSCSHLQCFDLNLFLQMNEKRPTWKCAVCNGNAAYSTIIIDQYFMTLLKEVPNQASDVQLLKDGTFNVVTHEVEDITDDDDDEALRKELAQVNKKAEVTKKTPVGDADIITLSDDDEDDLNLSAAMRASMPSISNANRERAINAQYYPNSPPPSTPFGGNKNTANDSLDNDIIIIDDTPPRPTRHPPPSTSQQPTTSSATSVPVSQTSSSASTIRSSQVPTTLTSQPLMSSSISQQVAPHSAPPGGTTMASALDLMHNTNNYLQQQQQARQASPWAEIYNYNTQVRQPPSSAAFPVTPNSAAFPLTPNSAPPGYAGSFVQQQAAFNPLNTAFPYNQTNFSQNNLRNLMGGPFQNSR